MAVPYTFASATGSIPLSQLDTNFATAIVIGNTSVYLGNTITTLNNITLANATISSVVFASGASLANVTLTGTTTVTGNITVSGNSTVSGTGLFSGNVQLTGSAARIQGDFSNATLANRTYFQDKTTNNNTTISVIPNGTATISNFVVNNNSDPTNASYAYIYCDTVAARLGSGQSGSGTYLPLQFVVNNAEAARFDTSGRFLVGGTTHIVTNSTFYSASGAGAISMRCTGATVGKYWYVGPDASNNYVNYNQSGTGVYVSDGGTSWTANSDERLKTDLVPIQNAAVKVNSLRAVTGRYITDDVGKSRSFLIAQDVQAVLPEAVTNNGEGYLGIGYTDVIPLLVAAIKELTARVATLEARP
jgi:hypothetical protein